MLASNQPIRAHLVTLVWVCDLQASEQTKGGTLKIAAVFRQAMSPISSGRDNPMTAGGRMSRIRRSEHAPRARTRDACGCLRLASRRARESWNTISTCHRVRSTSFSLPARFSLTHPPRKAAFCNMFKNSGSKSRSTFKRHSSRIWLIRHVIEIKNIQSRAF